MKFINGWKYVQKDSDRFELKLRIGLLTVLNFFVDISSRRVSVTLFNFTVEK